MPGLLSLGKIPIIMHDCIATGIILGSNLEDNSLNSWLQAWYCDLFRSQYMLARLLEYYVHQFLIVPCFHGCRPGTVIKVRVRVRYLTDSHKISLQKCSGKYLSNHVSQSIISTSIVINPSLIWRSVDTTFIIYPVFDTHIQL